MVNIYTIGGAILGVKLRYDVLLQIMRDNVIKSNDFIEFEFEDGIKGAVRKRHIITFCECTEETEV